MQHEITKGTPLLDESGNLTQAGYSKSPSHLPSSRY